MSTSSYHENIINGIIDKKFDYFGNFKNVNGIALGYKYVNGIQTKDMALHVLVSEKLPLNALSSNDIIPKYYQGIKTDVIEIGEIEAHALTARIRPMIEGYSIGPVGYNYAGTAGCMVTTGSGLNIKQYILSNNHVLANQNALPIGSRIVSPSIIDGGMSSTDVVATLSKFIPIQFKTATSTPVNIVDCAIAELVDNNVATNSIYIINNVKGTVLPSLSLQVQKSGRTTGYTTGSIVSTNASVLVNYGAQTAFFTNQIVTTVMSAPGDSGSLVLDMQNRAVGLLFAGSSSATVLNPITKVLTSLGIALI